jgi:hypothetical protein
MTHPDIPEVGSATDEPIIAAEPTIEDRFAARAAEIEKPEEDGLEAEQGDAPEAEAELTEEDVTDDEEGDDESLPPIAPPVSWTAEEKEEFKQLPRALQETLTRRESEREKFVQSKAQEAKQVEAKVHAQVSDQFKSVATTFAQQLGALRVPLPERPSHQLQAEDPYTYAEQMDAYERAAAHNHWIEQQVGTVGEQLRQAQLADHHRDQAITLAVLSTDFPEYLDGEKGPEIRHRLGSTAQKLGYTEEQINAADHHDIKAMKTATEWREKAEKYDRLMAKKMEKVRDAKNLPRVSRPGTAQGKGAVASQRLSADREAMRRGDRDAATRVFGRHL